MLKIIQTTDGSHSLYSEEYGSSYHSKHGAMQESLHVFIEHGLRYKSASLREISILEMGFGTGLNVWLALLEAERLGLEINYTTIEAHPLPLDVVLKLNYPDQLPSPNGKAFFEQIHTALWGEWVAITPHLNLQKKEGNVEELDLPSDFDLIFYDAFGPETQPALWEATMMQRMLEALKPGGSLVTFCAKGTFKRALKSVGFVVETLPGPPGKREMTRATKPTDFLILPNQ
ncbi:MAG: tRNA (5-methylaminomethyl-2-thiouridine)(34)-methyltransferase MnmD [Bacteroidetes bacterium]|nr:tRNA (5-methylaminomethyl-2-thiouridine)(34)-methyltransferase MnmD [Bacteroidota bacterium]